LQKKKRKKAEKLRKGKRVGGNHISAHFEKRGRRVLRSYKKNKKELDTRHGRRKNQGKNVMAKERGICILKKRLRRKETKETSFTAKWKKKWTKRLLVEGGKKIREES